MGFPSPRRGGVRGGVTARSIGIETQFVNDRAHVLRNNATAAERRLWYRLRQLKVSGQKFRRQVPIDHFIVDFACLSHRLIVEVDGATHSAEAEIASDVHRQRYLESQGFMVLRFNNLDVATNVDGVMDSIVGVLNTLAVEASPTPNPSPSMGRREDRHLPRENAPSSHAIPSRCPSPPRAYAPSPQPRNHRRRQPARDR